MDDPATIPMVARARANDPVTSTLAAQHVEATGRAAAHRERCLSEVRRAPGQTSAEIAVSVGMERHAAARRLPELRDAGLVVNGEPRECCITGRQGITWLPPAAPRLAQGELGGGAW